MSSNRAITDFFRPYTKSRPSLDVRSDKTAASPALQKFSSRQSRQHYTEAVESPQRNAPPSPTPARSSRSAHTVETAQCSPHKSSSLTSFTSRSSPSASEVEPAYIAGQFPAVIKPANPLRSSFSSLTTLPASSQSSSRRMVQHGSFVVTNSDSESIEQDSDSSLEDLDDLLAARKKRKLSSSPPSTAKIKEASTSRSQRSSHVRQLYSRKRETWAPPPPPKTSYKFNLSSLLDQQADEMAAARRIAEMEASLARAKQSPGPQVVAEDIKHDSTLDSGVVASIGDGVEDPQMAERLVQAMKRTDVLDEDAAFHFFVREQEAEMKRLPFPVGHLSSHGLNEMFKDPTKRAQACVTGFAADMAALQALPDEVLSWMINEGARKDLLSPDLGRVELPSSSRTQNQSWQPPSGVQHFTHVLSRVAHMLSFDAQRFSLVALLLLSIDEGILPDGGLLDAIEDAIAAVVDSMPDAEMENTTESIANLVRTSIPHPTLQHTVLTSVPSFTARLHAMKRQLALEFVLGNAEDRAEGHGSRQPTDVGLFDDLGVLLDKLEYAINEQTDYAVLAARISMMDIAISAGFSKPAFVATTASLPRTKNSDTDTEPELERSGSEKPVNRFLRASVSALPPPSPEEQAFNLAVDSLVQHLRQTASQIRDSGASHMRRTEAKSALEGLACRLEYAVRTRPKPKKGVFGSAAQGQESSMARFLGIPAVNGEGRVSKVRFVDERVAVEA
ncbi:hypothetical protein LTR66_006593 [Elasticomyces elasticus]|nr:hypothetical protein LTR66_006593 [Elasticomyces elasticus]